MQQVMMDGYVSRRPLKMTTETVNRTEFYSSDAAIEKFKSIHDTLELDVCKRNPYDAFIGGNWKHLLYY